MNIRTRRVVVSVFSLCIVLLLGIRIWYINRDRNRYMPTTKYYSMNESVLIGDNRIGGDLSAKGYSVKVLRANAYTKYELEKDLSVVSDMEFMDRVWYYVVKVEVTNESNENVGQEGITFGGARVPIMNTNYLCANMDHTLFYKLNPKLPEDGGASFSLRTGTSMEVNIPYYIVEGNLTNSLFRTDLDVLKENPPYLMITTYPVRQLIATFPKE